MHKPKESRQEKALEQQQSQQIQQQQQELKQQRQQLFNRRFSLIRNMQGGASSTPNTGGMNIQSPLSRTIG